MTVQKAITEADELRPNQYTNRQKVAWIDRLEQLIWEMLVRRHEMPEGTPDAYEPMDEDHMERELIAPDVWAEVYTWWLYAQMDLANMELQKYENDMIMYNEAWRQLESWWNRTYMPKVRVKAIEYGQNARAKGFDPLEA